MALDARIRELGSRHQSLEQAIQEELRHPAHDDIKLKELVQDGAGDWSERSSTLNLLQADQKERKK